MHFLREHFLGDLACSEVHFLREQLITDGVRDIKKKNFCSNDTENYNGL